MKRVLIVGISGTGKTRFANKLGEKLQLPVIHLDSIFWREDWVEEDERIVEHKIAREVAKKAWIIEGYIEPLSAERVKAADTIIFLDYPGSTALRGGIERSIKHRKTPRPEMPTGNVDSFGYGFLRSLYRRDERPEIEKAIQGSQKLIRLKSRRATNKYLNSILTKSL